MTSPILQLLAGNAPYRRFWIGFTLSVLGDALTRVALVWFVYEATGSIAAVGTLFVFYTAPLVVGGFAAGWALDRFDRRLVLIADNIVRGLAIGLVPLCHVLGLLSVWIVYAAAAVYGLFMMTALAGVPSLIPSLVEPRHLDAANALETLSYTVGGVAGSALAGILVAAIGAPATIVLDVGSYFLLALILLSLKLSPATRTRRIRAGSGFGTALAILAGNPVLLATTIMFALFNVGGGMLNIWLPALVNETLGQGPELYGFLLAAIAAGETASSVLVGIYPQRHHGLRICLAQIAAGLAVGFVFLLPAAWFAAVALFGFGFAGAPLTVWAQTLRMQIIPAEQRGRAFALLRLLMQAGNPAGAAIGGVLVPAAGTLATLAISAATIAVPGLAGLGVRSLRAAGSGGGT